MATEFKRVILAVAFLLAKVAASSTMSEHLMPFNHHGFDDLQEGHILESSLGLQSSFHSGTEGKRDGRRLGFLYDSSSSIECKKCIDENNFFCQNANGSRGQCCNSAEGCN